MELCDFTAKDFLEKLKDTMEKNSNIKLTDADVETILNMFIVIFLYVYQVYHVVHGDLKLENILCLVQGNNIIFKVCDF